MHLPAKTRRRIVYATAAVVVTGGLYYGVRSIPVSQPKEQPSATATIQGGVQLDIADAPANQAVAGLSGRQAVKTEEPRPVVQTYKVVEGDTIGAIAERFGLKTSTILWANDLTESSVLSVGQELLIPSTDGLVVKVREGDTLWDIASDSGADLDEVVKANPHVDPSALQPGQVLIVPGGKPVSRPTMIASRGGSTSRTFNGRKFAYWPGGGGLTDYFGWRTHPVYGTRHWHDGIDLDAPVGTPLRAVAPGTVTMAGWYGGYGRVIRIDHGGGLVTQYAHLSQIDVEPGQQVEGGEQIGLSGNSGVTTGPHLHFMVMVNGTAVNPLDYLP